MTNALTRFNDDGLRALLVAAHERLAQRHLPYAERSITARNYDSSIGAFNLWVQRTGETLPTYTALERWREDMLRDGVAVKTVNARLSAVRKLLRTVAADTTDIQTKLVLKDWATVADAKAIRVADPTEADYGIRLTLDELERIVNGFDTSNVKGLRDRALVALMAGAGLRVGEVVALAVSDVLATYNEHGDRGIRIRRGKFGKSRVSVLPDWSAWVLEAVGAYIGHLRLQGDDPVFRPVKYVKGNRWISLPKRLSKRAAQSVVEGITVEHRGQTVRLAAHDLRRTYAKLCRDYGMEWEALRDNLGHSSVTVTEKYVGKNTSWSKRKPGWTVRLR